MIIKHSVNNDRGKVLSAFDESDPRIFQGCSKCGNSSKTLESYVMKDWSNSGIHRETHRMRCANCNKHICTLPIKMTKEQAMISEMPWGKHQGLKLKDVPLDYLNWVLTNTDQAALTRKIRLMLDKTTLDMPS